MRMKISVLMLTFALLLLPTLSSAEEISDWIYSTDKIIYDVEIYSSFIPTNSPEDVTTELSLFPRKTSSQIISSLDPGNDATISEDKITYYWKGPLTRKQDFGIDSEVQVFYNFPKITKKISYPLKLDANFEFLKSTDSVDVHDPKIVALAEQLTAGEDDALVVAHKFASWVEQNIEYSLSTVTAKASLKSSWVLENRKGVCDELTNLFIALSRAAGIPARFVSGVSYTNSPLFPEGWGLHGWAEIYLPDVGWIPIDVTYKQFGRIDMGHITLKLSDDATSPSTKYTWKTGDIDSSKLEVDATPKSHSGEIEKQLNINVYPLRKQIGFNSYNLVVAEIENLKDYYVGEDLTLAVADNTLEIKDKTNKLVLLKPKEIKKVYWLIKSKDNLDKNFKYTSPIIVYTQTEQFEDSLDTINNDKVYSLDDMKGYLELSRPVKDGDDIALECALSEESVNEDQEIGISCSLKNKGTKNLNNLQFCIDGNCETTSLSVNGEKTLTGTSRSLYEGIQNIRIELTNDQVSKLRILPLNVEAEAKVEMEIKIFKEIQYEEEKEVKLEVSKRRGEAKNLNLKVLLNGKIIKQTNLEENSGGIAFTIPGGFLKSGKNILSYSLTYEDKEGNTFESTGEEETYLVNATFWQKIKLFLRHLI
jgi:transglutaminase-like putative cysteine protease